MSKKTTEKKKSTKTKVSSYTINSENLVKKIKEVVKEGNVRKIIIKNKEGKSLMEFPLTVGVVGTMLVPVLAAVGAIAALVKECTISVEKEE
jgi:hypothetical protein